jgi:hypothetical protein
MAITQQPQGYRLSELPPEPKAVPGCSGCLAIGVRRENARSRGDYSAVSDANVEMRQHHAQRHTA